MDLRFDNPVNSKYSIHVSLVVIKASYAFYVLPKPNVSEGFSFLRGNPFPDFLFGKYNISPYDNLSYIVLFSLVDLEGYVH